jgi:hypothetical protein
VNTQCLDEEKEERQREKQSRDPAALDCSFLWEEFIDFSVKETTESELALVHPCTWLQ